MTGLLPPGPLAYDGTPPVVNYFARPFAPGTNNTQFNLGTIWLDTDANLPYILVSKQLNQATWVAFQGFGYTLTPDEGGVVSPVGGTIDVTGFPQTVGGIKGMKTIGSATPGVLEFTNLDAITPYVVGTDPDISAFITIQSAIDQAVSDGASSNTPACIWITNGLYTEDLTLQPYVYLNGSGGTSSAVQIVGNATFDGIGVWAASNVQFFSPTFSAALTLQGVQTANIFLDSVLVDAGQGIGFECDAAGMEVSITNSLIQAESGGVCLSVSAGSIEIFATSTDFTDTPSLVSGGFLSMDSCSIHDAFSLTLGAEVTIANSSIVCDTLPAALIDTTSFFTALNCPINSINGLGNLVMGTGNFLFNNVSAYGSALGSENTLTVTGIPNLVGNLSFDGGNTFLSNDGEVWIGDTATGVPQPATLTAGTGVSIVNAGGSITISSVGPGAFGWTVVNAATQALAANNGYIVIYAVGLCTLTLPVTCAVGSTFIIMEAKTAGPQVFRIAQNAGQRISFGSNSATVGAGGHLQSQENGDTVTLICTVANTEFQVVDAIGNFTLV